MPILILTDNDLGSLLNMSELIPLMTEFLHAQAANTAVTPARHNVAFHPFGNLVFTIGGVHNQDRALAGFRAYHNFKTHADVEDTQIVGVWDSESGALSGLVLGKSLGEWRKGAIGGVAVQHMSRPDAGTCAVIGTGRQARTQLLAASACRTFSEVRVYSRAENGRRQFAAELTAELKLKVRAVETAREAVEGAEIVLCATRSTTPVLETAWLAHGAHVNSVGPKTRSSDELPIDIASRVSLIASDSIEQLADSPELNFLSAEPVWARLQPLSTLVAGTTASAPAHGDISLFCSTGLAGTEVLAAHHVLQRYRAAARSS